MKQIEDLTDDDLAALWVTIGGTPHLFEYGKDELKQVLITGECANENGEAIGLQLDYYTIAAIVDVLRGRGYYTLAPILNDEVSNTPFIPFVDIIEAVPPTGHTETGLPLWDAHKAKEAAEKFANYYAEKWTAGLLNRP